MSDTPLPQDDQLVTMVTVRDGNIFVASTTVLVSKPNSVAVEIDTSISEPPEFAQGQDVTLLYASGDRVMRLKSTVQEIVSSSRLTLRPAGSPKEGDRRDYRRADVTARLYVKALEGSDVAAARATQMNTDVSEEQFGSNNINLSGSGVQIESNIEFAPETLLDIRMHLPLPGNDLVQVLGRVVRSRPTDEAGNFSVAVRFAEIAEADQDRVVYTVFSRYFQSEGADEEMIDLTV